MNDARTDRGGRVEIDPPQQVSRDVCISLTAHNFDCQLHIKAMAKRGKQDRK